MADKKQRSIWDVAGVGTMTGGAGYLLYKNRASLASAMRTGSSLPYEMSQRSKAAARFNIGRGIVTNPIPLEDATRSALENLKSFGGQSNIYTDVRARTYEALAAGGKLTHSEMVAKLSGLAAGSPLETYQSAMNIVAGSGDSMLFNRRTKELISEYESMARASSLSNMSVSSGIGAVPAVQELTLSGKYAERASKIQKAFQQATGETNSVSWAFKSVEDVIKGKKVQVPLMVGSLADQEFVLPLADVGKTYSGKYLSTSYVTRKAYDASAKQIQYTDYAVGVLTNTIRQSKDRYQLKTNVSAALQNIIDKMSVKDSAHRSAAVWSLPEQVLTAGGLAKARLTSQEAIAYGITDPEEIKNIIGKGLYPYVSPAGAGKGVLTTKNLSEDLFGPLGQLMSAEQRPTQFVRSEWGITEAAKQRARGFGGTFGKHYSRLDRKTKGPLYDRILYGNAPATSRSAYSSPQFVTYYPRAGKGSGIGFASDKLNQMLSAEEGVISSSVADMMEYERIVQKKIMTDNGFAVNSEILKGLKGSPISAVPTMFEKPIGGGAIVGLEHGTGKEVSLMAGDISQEVIGARMSAPNVATTYIRERRRLNNEEIVKLFSEENKYLATSASEGRMRALMSAAGPNVESMIGQPIEAIFPSKLVARNKMALITQQMEAASMIVSRKIDTGQLQLNEEISRFLANPTASLNVSKIMAERAVDADLQIQKGLVGLTKKWQFSPEELGLTFGLTSRSDLSKMARSGLITPQELWRMAKSGVIGLGKGKIGDIATEGGSGRFGSIEQSGIRLLAMKGEEGKNFAVELAKRLHGKGELGAIEKAEQTVLGQQGLFDKLALGDVEDFAGQGTLIREQGRYVNLGRNIEAFGGANKLYIPGMQEAPMLTAPFVRGDARVKTPFVDALHTFRQTLIDANNGKTTTEELESAATGLRNTVSQLTAKQSAASGKVVGTQILTGMRRGGSDAFRISEASAERMFSSLISAAQTDDQIAFLKGQYKALQEGKTVVGGMWRHPTTGPESVQFVKYKVDKSVTDGMLVAPAKFGKIQYQDGRIQHIDLSEMVGFSGDFDKDQYVLSAISNRDTASRVSKKIGTDIADDYTQHVFNHYAMKDLIDQRATRKSILEMGQNEAMQYGYEKLSTAKTATGGVNVALQRLKLAVAANAPEQYKPLAHLFQNLEQTAISGKHQLFGSSLYKAIGESVRLGGEEGTNIMENVISSLLGPKGTVTGKIGERELSFSFSSRELAQTAMSSLDASRQEVGIAMRSNSLARGGEIGQQSLTGLVEQSWGRRQGSIDVAQSVMRDAGTEMRIASKLGSFQTKARAFVNAISKVKKPLLFTAAAGVGIMLASPSKTKTAVLPEGPQGGRNVEANQVFPSGPGMEHPPQRQTIAPRVYDIGSSKYSSRVNIRARLDDLDNSRDFSSDMNQLSQSGQVNIKVRDDRSTLDPRRLASKIHERL